MGIHVEYGAKEGEAQRERRGGQGLPVEGTYIATYLLLKRIEPEKIIRNNVLRAGSVRDTY